VPNEVERVLLHPAATAEVERYGSLEEAIVRAQPGDRVEIVRRDGSRRSGTIDERSRLVLHPPAGP
jgi:hypothetical protein